MNTSMPHSHMHHPFHIVPWQSDFLSTLMQHVIADTNGNPGNAIVIFPHSRPKRYFIDCIKNNDALPKPCLLPHCYSVTDFFSLLRTEIERDIPESIELLDRVGLLTECMKELDLADDASCKAWQSLPLDDEARFFPWGMRLAKLLEDFFNQNLVPEDYHYMEGQVVDFAAQLLGQLGKLHTLYTEKLIEKGWTTPGFDAFQVLQHIDTPFQALKGKHIYIAGFYGLTGVEKALFSHLWTTYNATVFLHTDPAILPDVSGSPHWAIKEHSKWIAEWKADSIIATHDHASRNNSDQIRQFYEGFDLHSQLDVMQQQLTAAETDKVEGSTAVVLPDSALLMPALHHLPKKDVNISMGYPLGHSTLFRLIETIMALQDTRRGSKYYWKHVVGLIRHPYIKMLNIDGESVLNLALHQMEKTVRQGQSFIDPRSLPVIADEVLMNDGSNSDSSPAVSPEAAMELLQNVLSTTLDNWEDIRTPAQLGESLAALCSLLITHGGDLWERFPIDAESMFRLLQRVVPALKGCSLAHTEYPRQVLFIILKETIRGERVPFEADPLTGVQVLGVLETRLLHFDTLHILDATEDNLPGSPAHDPLLPDTLRSLLGLPDTRHRERVSAYNFYRLVMGAKNLHIYYQTGVEQSGLFEQKKIRSRFVEEMIWEEEQKQTRLIHPGDAPLHAITYPVTALCQNDRPVIRTDAVNTRILSYLTRPLSPSALDTYLQCPVRFYYERVCNLRPVDEVNEGDDFAGIGELFHTVLENFHKQYIDRQIQYATVSPDQLQAMFVQELHASNLADALPYTSFLMLETAGQERLARFLRNQPETMVKALEIRLESEVTTPDALRKAHGSWSLAGRMDRIDERGGNTIILDYKTGTVKKPQSNVWLNDEFWDAIETWDNHDDDTLEQVAKHFSSVQLPSYLYVYPRAQQCTVSSGFNAGWVELKDSGKEIFLFNEKLSDDTIHTAMTEQIPSLIEFLFNHIAQSPVFRPQRGLHCAWCPCANCCSM